LPSEGCGVTGIFFIMFICTGSGLILSLNCV
jgi:hypothetical protein